MEVSIIGLGYIGTVIGAVLSEKGFSVTGIDVDKSIISNLNKGTTKIPEPKLNNLVYEGVEKGLLRGRTDYESIKNSKVVLITVGTPLLDNLQADLKAIKKVFKSLSSIVNDGQIIMVKSTVPPGITRKMFNEFLKNKNIYLGFSPERLAEGNAIEELKKLPIVVGGINEESTKKCSKFWKDSLGIDIIEVSSLEAAELVKLADNQWIDLNIALANELAILCDSLPYELDVMEIINGANSLKKGNHNVNILNQSIGVGGYCLTKDPWFLDSLSKKNKSMMLLPSSGRKINESMPKYVSNQIDKFLQKNSINKNKAKVSILGYSFKSNSGDVRFTPIQSFIEEILNLGYKNIQIFDSLVQKEDISRKGLEIVNNWEDSVKNANCVVFGTSHDDIMKIPIKSLVNNMAPNGLIYDGRRYFSKREIQEIKKMGISYKGVGRS